MDELSFYQKIVESVRALGEEGRKLAEDFDNLTYEDLLQVIVDDSDIDEALGALDSLAQDAGGDSLMTILKRWAENNPNRAAIDSQRKSE